VLKVNIAIMHRWHKWYCRG